MWIFQILASPVSDETMFRQLKRSAGFPKVRIVESFDVVQNILSGFTFYVIKLRKASKSSQ